MVRVTVLMQADRTRAQIKALAVLIVYAFCVNWALKGTEPTQLKVLQRFRYRLSRKPGRQFAGLQEEHLLIWPDRRSAKRSRVGPKLHRSDRQTRSGPSDQARAGAALASSRLSRRSRPSARDSSGGRRRLQRQARRSRGVCSGRRSITVRSWHSPNRIGFNVQQVLELAGRVVSRVQAVRDNRNTLVQKQPQSFGGQLGQSQVVQRPERSSPLRSQDRQQTSQPSCVQTWHRGKGYDRSCSEQGNAEPDCGNRPQRLKHCPRKLTCDSRSRSPGPAVPVGSDQRDRPQT